MSEVSNARRAAAYVLRRCRRFDAWSQQTIRSAAEQYSLDERDAALCSQLCLSVLRNAALCDWYIDAFSSTPSVKLQPQILDLLRLGVCQILFLDKIPDHAAVSQTVSQAKAVNPRAAGLVNAVLRRVVEKKYDLPPLPEPGTARELSIRYSHPLWLCEKLVNEYGFEHAKAFLEASNRESDLTLTVNLCRTEPDKLAEKLRANGYEVMRSPLTPVSLVLGESASVPMLPGFEEGEFFVQDAAATLPVLSADPGHRDRVLDVCAAPGGKSFLCAVLMGDMGEILACDIHENKLSRIEEGAKRLGFSSVRTAPMDASKPYEQLKESFDLVLADAPCSGMGVIRKKPEIRYKDPKDLLALPAVQLRILEGAASCVKPGGKLVYSTCTVFREENGEVVSAFLARHPDFRSVEERTVWPQEYGTDGFYYCKMMKYENDQR